MNALIVSVDYTDLLSLTLPFNRHHFDRVLVVSDFSDDPDLIRLCRENRADLYRTNVFTDGGAVFNKWAAVEEGLDVLGRDGWMCVMDADVCFPKRSPFVLSQGRLYTPHRLMCPTAGGIPPEETWRAYPVHPNVNEWAGYTHVFYAADPVLKDLPWYDTGWRHAGGGDSLFQRRWPPENKVRPPFHVLHLGPAGMNWCGRTTPYPDGTAPPKASSRLTRLREFIRGRRHTAWTDPTSPERLR